MPTKIELHPKFEKQLAKLIRKFPSLIKEFRILEEQLSSDERPGEKIPNVRYDVYKERLRNPQPTRAKVVVSE